jgi:DNA polymerase elongation subunit (family B)
VLSLINPNKLLYIDIETVPGFGSHDALSEPMRNLWAHKHSTLRVDAGETAEEGYFKRAGIYAEFGKIVCICAGYFYYDKVKNRRFFRMKSFAGEDEKQVLSDFIDMLDKNFKELDVCFCGHNIKEFDIPYICRRALINGIKLPPLLDISGKKPWELPFVDTMDLWKFGDYKSFTSLKLLTEIFGIPSPKDDIDGKDVGRVFWQEKDVNRIAEYCKKDVISTARLVLKMKGDAQGLDDDLVVNVN